MNPCVQAMIHCVDSHVTWWLDVEVGIVCLLLCCLSLVASHLILKRMLT